MTRWLLLVHAAATWYLVGLIWFVQVVHYPLFDAVGEQGFVRYEERHRGRTGIVVAPAMLIELATAILLVWRRPAGITNLTAWGGLGAVVLIWLSTFLIQVPMHETLSAGWRHNTHAYLVLSNWGRTAAWTVRGLLVLWWLSRV